MSITFYAGFEESPKRWNYVESVEPVNVSNSNGYALIAALRFTAEDGGMEPVDIDTFIARCTAALRNAMRSPDPGVAVQETIGARGATFIDCGRPEGYLESRIRQLSELAREGKAAGGTHIYAG